MTTPRDPDVDDLALLLTGTAAAVAVGCFLVTWAMKRWIGW